jgi:thymidine phosphorylase
MLLVSGRFANARAARQELERALASGEALERFRRMVRAHGGDVRAVDDPKRLPRAKLTLPVRATESGVVHSIDARELGLSAIVLGAGRTRADQPVDPAAGIVLEVGVGAPVERGQTLAVLHTRRREHADEVSERVRAAFHIARKSRKNVSRTRLVLGKVSEP